MPRMWRRNQRLRSLGDAARPMGVSYGLIGSILGLGALGYMLDTLLATSPWLLVGGLMLGMVIGLAGLGRLMANR